MNIKTYKFEFLNVKKENHHLEITLNRPKKKNALNSKMIKELSLCSEYANNDDEIRAVVYRSKTNIFCSGLDLNDFSEGNENIKISDIFNKLYKPKLVVLDGDVYAGGLLFVLCSNHVISKTNVVLRLPETLRGLFPFQVMDALFRIMPKKIAINWCIEAKKINTKDALKYNIIDEVCEGNTLEKEKKWLKKIYKVSPNAVKSGLRIYDELYINDDTIKSLEKELKELRKSEDFNEGIKAFKERREPKW